MSENVSTVEVDLKDPTVVAMAFEDPDLSKLDVRSDEFKAALAEKAGKTNNDDTSADVETAEDDEVEPDEETSEDETEEGNEQPKKKPRGLVRRVEKLVAERNRLQEELDTWRRKAEAQVDSLADNLVIEEFEAPKPQLSQFDTLEEYTEALTEWKLDKRDFERNIAQQKQTIQQTIHEAQRQWEERESVAKKEFRDYNTVVTPQAIVSVSPSEAAKSFLADSDVGPKVVYMLLDDETLAAEFANAGPAKQVRMLTALENQFVKTSEEKTTVSRAPQPPSKLGRGSSAATTKDILANSAEMSFSEWEKLFNQATRKKK